MISPRKSSAATSLKLGRLALVGIGAALLAAACSIGNSDDNEPGNGTPNTGGQAGDTGDTGGTGGSTGGSTTGGTGGSTGGTETGGQGGEVSTGGTGGTGGTATELDCHEDGDVAGTYETLDLDECFQCAMDECEAEFQDCFAQGPDSVCGFDSAGGSDDSELYCMIGCFDGLHSEGLFIGGQEDIDDCKAMCASSSCSATEATSVTQDLAACLLGVTDGSTGCQFECGYRCIGDEGCDAHNGENDREACEADTANNCSWTE